MRYYEGISSSQIERLKSEQLELSKKLILKDKKSVENIRHVAGIDVTFRDIWKRSTIAIACITVINIKDNFNHIETVFSEMYIDFPYIPTFLAYRELPPILDAYKKLNSNPDAFIIDGMGIIHPRKMGIASHFGILTGEISVGCGKSKLIGEYEEPDNKNLSYKPVFIQGEKRGYILRTKKNTKPVFVSPGNNISIESSLKLVINCLNGYKLPEPTRIAHKKLQEYRRKKYA